MTAWVCGLPPRMAWDDYDEDEVHAVALASKAGDRDAFGELYRRFYRRVLVWLQRRVRNDDDAEELAQEVFLKAMSLVGTYQRREDKPFVAWLIAVAKMVLDAHRRSWWLDQQAVSIETDRIQRDASDGSSTEQDSADAKLSSEVAAAFDGLTAAQRRCVQMRYLEGLPASTVATLCECTESAVNNNCYTAVKRLRRDLVPQVPAQQRAEPAAGTVLYTIAEAAIRTGRSARGLHTAIQDQRLTAHRVNGRLMVSAAALDAFHAIAQPPRPPRRRRAQGTAPALNAVPHPRSCAAVDCRDLADAA
ncbi:sigma-70 family RNA polymerase sigma factor [Amycolatopsis sp. GM8]|uniref:sigma-70 family RNA polymerase sigma factor n=1 Tax=Amycolatopsis sp. GM8 TaxID=2896530 RepID=UPI001F0206D6|nr:sigma-70 family RNA polymerase sigma factor [Amycolatopsis sp. GM8]